MNRFVIYAGVFISGLIIQFSFMQFFSISGLAPNFILIFLVFIGLMYGPMAGQLFGFSWGLAWDIFSVDLFGSHAFLLTCIGFFSGLLSKKWNESKFSAQAVLVLVASVFYLLGQYLLYQIFSPGARGLMLNYINLLQPFYNVLVTPLVFIAAGMLSVIIGRVILGEGDIRRF